ncbi:MAG: hypothetical protein F6K19_10175, partial [Cyanothece sp. SIO1E1]|nr:hypothetical protein [Cyanothece sp. SIO1E1]
LTYQPQVRIVRPRQNEVIKDTTVSVRFYVQDLPIFKHPDLGLGPHLEVILDNHHYQSVYSLDKPLVLSDLSPGSHTLRVFASRPWYEGFKNEGAYAQTTFHVFTQTPHNNPVREQPLLTYSRPHGIYGAEPILLDFYLTNLPLHWVAQADPDDDILDWYIRCTVNNQSFTFDRWQPIYLKGFKPGQNWIKLELLDEAGNLIRNEFNTTAKLINYEPGAEDSLSKLIRGKLSVAARGIVDPKYRPEPPAVTPESEPPAEAISPSRSVSPSIPAEPPIVEPLPDQSLIESPTQSATPDLPEAPSVVESTDAAENTVEVTESSDATPETLEEETTTPEEQDDSSFSATATVETELIESESTEIDDIVKAETLTPAEISAETEAGDSFKEETSLPAKLSTEPKETKEPVRLEVAPPIKFEPESESEPDAAEELAEPADAANLEDVTLPE